MPFGLIVATGLLYWIFGPAGLLGSFIFVTLVVVEIYLGLRQRKLRLKIGAETDEKVKILTAIIEGMRVVKMYGWEFTYQKMIENYRNRELSNQRTNSIYDSFYWAVLLTMTGIVLFAIFTTFIALGNELTSAQAFTGFSIVFVALNVFVGVPAIGFGDILQISASLSRIGDVLQLRTCDSKYANIDETKGIVI